MAGSFAFDRCFAKTRPHMTMTGALVSSLSLLAAAVTWGVAVAGSSRWDESSAVVFGVVIIVAAAVAIVGMVAGASRWAFRLAVGLSAALVAAGLTMPLTTPIVLAMGLAALALAGLGGTAMRGMIRQRPAADGPPPNSVTLGLLLLLSPGVWAFVTRTGMNSAALAAAVLCWVGMAVYLKATPVSLVTARIALPVSLGVLAAFSGWPTGALIASTAVGAGALAWTVEARIAVEPLARPGSTVPIPPELAPRDVLDAAGIDDRGRRTDRSPE